MTKEAIQGIYEAITMPTIIMYVSETWMLNAKNVSHGEVDEMRCWKSMCGSTKYNRIRNERSQ